MNWYQAFPYPTPDGRSYVSWRPDLVQRVAVEQHQYGLAMKRMGQWSPEGFWLLEWDMALSQQDMTTLEAAARWKPELCHAASFSLYDYRNENGFRWNQPAGGQLPVYESSEHKTESSNPGLGVVWIPEDVIAMFNSEDFWRMMVYPTADGVFWNRVGRGRANMVSGVNPIHLHW